MASSVPPAHGHAAPTNAAPPSPAIPAVTIVANAALTVDPPVLTGSWRLPDRR
jgi:hypothetical protein